MAKLDTVNVIVAFRGILEEVHSFDNFNEAEELFRNLVKKHDKEITAEKIDILVENGEYENHNYTIWIFATNKSN